MVTKLSLNLPVYIGAGGLVLGLFFILFFLFRRIRWIVSKTVRKETTSPKLLASLRNLVMIFLWTAVFGLILFVGFFFQAYMAFTYEEPVAQVITQPGETANTSLLTLTQFLPDGSKTSRQFTIKGDQWMLEGDIIKLPNWLNFLGWHTRYRLTRLRGRYLQAEDEISKEKTIYPLVEKENHPLWRHLYNFGHKMPFVSTVYGNAVFQTSGENNSFLVYAGTSGFIVRKEERPKDKD